MSTWWRRFGDIPASFAVAVLFAALLLGAATLDRSETQSLSIGLAVILVLYCVARPYARTDVFFSASSVGASGTLLHDLFGISSLYGLVLLPIVLLHLIAVDREKPSVQDAGPLPKEDARLWLFSLLAIAAIGLGYWALLRLTG